MNKDERWLCLDCGKNTFEGQEDWYFLRNRLWRQLVPRHERHGMICRACIERRLGRQLTSDDFRKATDDESDPEDQPMQKQDYGIIDSLTPQMLQAIERQKVLPLHQPLTKALLSPLPMMSPASRSKSHVSAHATIEGHTTWIETILDNRCRWWLVPRGEVIVRKLGEIEDSFKTHAAIGDKAKAIGCLIDCPRSHLGGQRNEVVKV